MILPLVSSLSEDALYALPKTLREGSFAMGATKFQTSFRVIIPAALSGISVSIILALSRAIGETMIVAIAAGQQPRFTFNPFVPIETCHYLYRTGKFGRRTTGFDRIQNHIRCWNDLVRDDAYSKQH